MVFVKFGLSCTDDAENHGKRIHFVQIFFCFLSLWCPAAGENYLVTGGAMSPSVGGLSCYLPLLNFNQNSSHGEPHKLRLSCRICGLIT